MKEGDISIENELLDIIYSYSGFSIGLLALFREKLNRQGKPAKALSDNAFGVYVFHPPILIAITMS